MERKEKAEITINQGKTMTVEEMDEMSDYLEKTRTVTIENSQFCYLLHIEGQSISFQGAYAADFFEKFFKKNGYEVTRTKNQEDS